jgi:hypothetical protein
MPHQSPSEVDINYEAFIAELPSILPERRGQFALLHRRKIVEYYSSAVEAATEGYRKFGEEAYSVQEVTDEADNLGFYSYAGGAGQA